ncbi:hypothetical protein KAR91_38330, partial [Candidatus Pacearchaeota archaeon]|nr:hypothetical protein [Candidatus Pacearchaeota archaeon]
MPINFYPRLSLTGGVAGSLDNLDGAIPLQVGDVALVGEGTTASVYIATADGNAESSPDIIVPDTNPGSWNWVLLTLGSKSITTDFVDFDTAYSDGSVEGRLQWNADDGTLEYGLPGGNVTLQVGQEHVIKVRNTTGATIVDGTPIYFSGSSANRPLIAKADATDHAKSHVEGLTTEDIGNNSNGYVTLEGLVRDIDTDHLTEGADVWLDPASPGTTTNTRPTAPNSIVKLGHCVVKNATTGVLLVHPNPLMKMMEGSDVLYDADPDDNEILQWNEATSRFELTVTPLFTTVDATTDFTVGGLVISDADITDDGTLNIDGAVGGVNLQHAGADVIATTALGAEFSDGTYTANLMILASGVLYIQNDTAAKNMYLTIKDNAGVAHNVFSGVSGTAPSAIMLYDNLHRVQTTAGGMSLTDSTSIALFEYSSGNLYLKNTQHAGNTYLTIEDSAGTQRTMLGALANGTDPQLYLYAGAGIWVLKTEDDGTNGGFRLSRGGSAGASLKTNSGTGDVTLKNLHDGADVYIIGQIATDTDKTIFKGTPDGAVTLYYAGGVSLATTAAGISIADGTATAATIGFSSDDLVIQNNDQDGHIIFKAEKTAGGTVTMIDADPDT